MGAGASSEAVSENNGRDIDLNALIFLFHR
jgi:hypothetical protein